jgi:hypothetical protein
MGMTRQGCTDSVAGLLAMIVPDLQASVAAGRVAYHGDNFAACLNVAAALICPAARSGISAEGAMSSCAAAFEPKVAIGGDCADGAECINGWCDGVNNGTLGKCVAKKANGAGCGSDSECTSGGCDNICGPRAPSGGLCQ